MKWMVYNVFMNTQFHGQQDDERILYTVYADALTYLILLIKFLGASIGLVVLFWILGLGYSPATAGLAWGIRTLGLLAGMGLMSVGWWMVQTSQQKNVTYITDRRIVRFAVTAPWSVVTRSISWDEVVKIKTRSLNLFWRALGIGTVVVHARSTITPLNEREVDQPVTNDDIQIDGVAYYQDLGYYMDKILYLSKKEPQKLGEIRPFVARPKGKRY